MSRAIALTLTTRAIQIVSGFAASILTARFLGPSARGEYFFIATLALVVVQFANLGLQASNTYKVAQRPELFGALVANTVWTSIVLGLSGAIVAAVLLKTTSLATIPSPDLLWFTVGLAPAMLVFMLGVNLLVGTQRITVFNVFETGGNLLVVAALVIAGVSGGGVSTFLAASCLAWGTTSVALLVYLVRASGAQLRFRWDVLTDGVRYAAKAYLIALLGYLVLRGNVFVLQRYYGARELGYYSVAAQVGDALAILPASVALVLFPRLVQNRGARWQSTLRSAAAVALALAAVCGIAAALASPFMRIAFGQAFTPAAQILRLMLPGVFAVGVTTILSQYLGAIGMPKVSVAIWGVALISVLVLGLLLIPAHAGAGAAAALSVTYLLVLGLIGSAAYHYREAKSSSDAGAEAAAIALEAAEPPVA